MAKKILTYEELEDEYDVILSHGVLVDGSNIIRTMLNTCSSAKYFFSSGLPLNCPECGATRPRLGPNATVTEKRNWYMATSWQCTCGRSITDGDTKEMGLTFVNGTTASTRLIAENTLVPPQDLKFTGGYYTGTTANALYSQYHSTMLANLAEIYYGGSGTLTITKKSGTGNFTISKMAESGGIYDIHGLVGTWVADSNGAPVGASDTLKYEISANDATTKLTLYVHKSGNAGCVWEHPGGTNTNVWDDIVCKDSIWIDGWDGNGCNFFTTYRSWMNSGRFNGVYATSNGTLPIVNIPDYQHNSNPFIPILIYKNTTSLYWPGLNGECHGQYCCGTLQYAVYSSVANVESIVHVTAAFNSGSNVMSNTDMYQHGFVYLDSQSISFFQSSSSGGAGYHTSDPHNHLNGMIYLDAESLDSVPSWNQRGEAILLIYTGRSLSEPYCQFMNQIILLKKNNSYYVVS